MKKLRFTHVIIVALTIVMTACSDELQIEDFSNHTEIYSATAEDFNISEREALALADKVTGNNATRAYGMGASIAPVYALSEGTRADASTIYLDTIAYIVNYADNNGFSIISKDNRINPILAYSTTGNFSLSNEIAKEQFIDRLSSYMKIKCVGNKKYDDSNVEDACQLVNNMITVCLGQRSPFDKYVIKDYPGCPVGCVAVASALVMMHSKKFLSYGKYRYHFSDMRKYLATGAEVYNPSLPTETTSSAGLEPNTGIVTEGSVFNYFQAVDYTAELLYQIGKDVNMTYTSNASGASSYNAYTLIKSLGFNVVTGYETMSLNDVADHLKDNCIIYMRGSGHAWVADGCRYCIDITTRAKRDIYINCDWGWYGYCNGYYSGDVFVTKAGQYAPTNYFAVKREVSE